MNVFLKSIAVTLGLGALLALDPAHATTNVPIQVFLVNLSPQAITSVTWTDSSGNTITSGTVASGGIIALGAMSVPATQTSSIGISQTASNGSAINTSFTLSNNCGWEAWPVALALQQANPNANNNAQGPVSYTSLVSSPPPSNGTGWFAQGSANTSTVCLSNNNQFAVPDADYEYFGCPTDHYNEDDDGQLCWPIAIFPPFPSAYSSNYQPLVLGSYMPTGLAFDNSTQPAFWNLGATSTAPGLTLSPTGITPAIGTSVVIPYNSNDFAYWPVTIYYGVDSMGSPTIPLVAPNQTYCPPGYSSGSSMCQQLPEVYPPYAGSEISPSDAVNVPSYFTNFQDSGVESAYMAPNAGNTTVNGFASPMPCWPLFNTSDEFIGCNGAPQYVSNGSTKTAASNTILSTMKNVVETTYDLVEIASVF